MTHLKFPSGEEMHLDMAANQPRDKAGKFASTGGSGSVAPASNGVVSLYAMRKSSVDELDAYAGSPNKQTRYNAYMEARMRLNGDGGTREERKRLSEIETKAAKPVPTKPAPEVKVIIAGPDHYGSGNPVTSKDGPKPLVIPNGPPRGFGGIASIDNFYKPDPRGGH